MTPSSNYVCITCIHHGGVFRNVRSEIVYLRKSVDKSSAFPIYLFAAPPKFILGWVKVVRTTKSYVCAAQGGICRVNAFFQFCSLLFSLYSQKLISLPSYLWPFIRPWPLFQFLDLFTQSVGLFGRGISASQGRHLHRGKHKHRIKCTHTSMPQVGFESTIPVFEGEASSCLRKRGHCDRQEQ
jgi:hypothetical protein